MMAGRGFGITDDTHCLGSGILTANKDAGQVTATYDSQEAILGNGNIR